jgi:hypothetical protein
MIKETNILFNAAIRNKKTFRQTGRILIHPGYSKLLMGCRLLLLMLPVMLLSCEEKVDWPLDTNVPKVIVVEGVLTNERKAHEVKISKPMADINGVPEPISGALVAIFQGENAIRLHEKQPGRYLTDTNVRAVYGKLYTLYIFYQDREYYGSSYMVPVGQMDPLSYRKIPGQEFWYEMNLRETDRPSMMEIRLDWGHLIGFRNLPREQTRARIVYYTVQSIDVNKIFRPAKERVPFPVGTRVYRRKYSMNEWQEDFVRTLMAETEWRGGLFDVQPGNVRTNLSEGAVGYFSVSTVVADTSIILPLN